MNWLYIGKCYIKLKNKDEAYMWLTKAAEQTGVNQDDTEVCNYMALGTTYYMLQVYHQ